jgi:hypothetical protein
MVPIKVSSSFLTSEFEKRSKHDNLDVCSETNDSSRLVLADVVWLNYETRENPPGRLSRVLPPSISSLSSFCSRRIETLIRGLSSSAILGLKYST